MYRKEFEYEYTAGFLFSEHADNHSRVLLINKLRPSWQNGLINGIGGNIEDGETPFECMCREFKEETELEINSWRRFCVLTGRGNPLNPRGDNWRVHFFAATGTLGAYRKMTDEQPVICRVAALPANCIPNLHYLIPMARSIVNDQAEELHIYESYDFMKEGMLETMGGAIFRTIQSSFTIDGEEPNNA